MSRPLRIAHVLPYVSADGAFGGPVAVAVEQCRELARQGHRVVLIAGWDGEVEFEVEGVDVRLFRARAVPGLGFSGLLSPGLSSALRRHVTEFDVVHIHMGRHLLALAAARACRWSRIPYILQTHGMVSADSRPKAKILDALLVNRALRGARTVLALTEAEQCALGSVSRGSASISRIRNGVASHGFVGERAPDQTPEVLFLARLHPRKRVLAFAEMAALLQARGLRARFAVVGPNEGDLPRLRDFMAENPELSLHYEGSIAPGASILRLAKADVFVLPSVGEVFPMTVLESMSVGTPVVLTEDCGISGELLIAGAAAVTDGTAAALADAVEALLTAPEAYRRVVDGMQDCLKSSFGIAAVARDLVEIYARSTN